MLLHFIKLYTDISAGDFTVPDPEVIIHSPYSHGDPPAPGPLHFFNLGYPGHHKKHHDKHHHHEHHHHHAHEKEEEEEEEIVEAPQVAVDSPTELEIEDDGIDGSIIEFCKLLLFLTANIT